MRRWLSRLFGFGAGVSAGDLGPPGGFSAWTPSWGASSALASSFGRRTKSGEVVSEASAVALPSVYRCCSLISDALSSMELRVEQRRPDGGTEVITDSDAARALAEWSYTDKELVTFHCALGGNGFAIIRRNERGGIASLEPKLPRRITALVDEAHQIWYNIAPDVSCGETEWELVPASDALLLKFRNVGDRSLRSVFAVPPIVSCSEALGLVQAARSFQASLWRNGTIPSGVLTAPTILKQEVIDRLRSQWQEYYGGDNTGRTAVLEQGMKWEPVKGSVSAADANLTEVAQFGVNEIARLYGIPPSLLSQTIHASYSTSVEESRALILHCLRPWSIRFCDALSRSMLTREQRLKGMRIAADLSPWTLAPGKEMADFLSGLVNSGIKTVNECRQILGDAKVAGGDTLRVPVNQTSIDNLGKIGLGGKPSNTEGNGNG